MFEPTSLAGVFLLRTEFHTDNRGELSEVYDEALFIDAGLNTHWPIDVQSSTRTRNTIRGLHYQVGDADLAKAVRVLKGEIFDVVVDLRPDSPTFREWIGIRIDSHGPSVYVPEGCAHGFQTLSDDVVIYYKMGKLFEPSAYRGIRFDCETLAIRWPLDTSHAVISAQDRDWPEMEGASSP